MTLSQPKAERQFTGRHMWLVALSFFGVIISVNVVMATLAMRSWTGLVVDNSYVASQHFEEKRLAHEAQRAAGWQPVLTYESGSVRLTVLDAAHLAVDLDSVTALFNRPVGGHDDRTLILTPGADGSFQAALDLPEGLWEATVTATSTLGPFELRERFAVGADP